MSSNTKQRSALLIVDVQKALIQGAYREAETLEAIQIVTAKVREGLGLVVYIQHCHSTFEAMKKGNPGWEVHDALEIRDDDVVIEKEASDSFYETDLDEILNARGVNHIYVTGLQTEYCVDATCRSALSKGYKVTLVKDGHTTGDSWLSAEQVIEHHNALLANLAHPKHNIRVVDSSEL